MCELDKLFIRINSIITLPFPKKNTTEGTLFTESNLDDSLTLVSIT